MKKALGIGLIASLLTVGCGGGTEVNNTAQFASVLEAPQIKPLALVAIEGTTATFSGVRGNYTVSRSATGYTVADNIGSDGTRTFTAGQIKVLKFADISIDLDIINKTTTVSSADLSSLIELYIAYMNRVPDAEGLSYWIDQLKAGMSLEEMGKIFYEAAVANASLTGYLPNASNEDFVRIVYKNVLARATPDPEGLAYWTNNLNSGAATRGTLVKSMLASAHTFNGDATYGWVYDLLINKIAVAYEHTVNQGVTYNSVADAVTTGKAITSAVTATDTTEAETAIDNLMADKRAVSSTILSGNVSMGSAVSDGTVSAYSVVNGAKSTFIASAKVDFNGQYTLNLGSYTGPVLLEVSGGTYKDPVTGTIATVSTAIRTAVADASGAVKANITPYTEAAVVNASAASGGLTTINITVSFDNVKAKLGFDPRTTKPANIAQTSADFATSKSIGYGVHLGTLSQYKAENVIANYNQAIANVAEMLASVQPFMSNEYIQQAANNYVANANAQNPAAAGQLCIPPDLYAMYTVPWRCSPAQTPPAIKCVAPNVLQNGVCISQAATTPINLTKTWTGTWSWSGAATQCSNLTLNNGGALTFSLNQSGSNFSGSVTANGVQSYSTPACQVTSTGSRSGSVSGTISGTTVKWTMVLNGIGYTGSGAVANGIMSGSVIRDSVGGSGAFNLQ
jgi:hypothetical protein